MNIYAKKGDKVKYIGCSDVQIEWRSHDDPRIILKVGEIYEVGHTVVHSCNTEVYLKGYEQYDFNSVCFEDVEDDSYFKNKAFEIRMLCSKSLNVLTNGEVDELIIAHLKEVADEYFVQGKEL